MRRKSIGAMLSATFLAHTKVRLKPPPDATELGHLLTRVWQDARAKWPTVDLAPELFVRHLAERLPRKEPSGPVGLLLKSMALADLYLACACLHGIPAAIEAFELHYLSKVRKLLQQRGLSATSQDEICQLIRTKVLVPSLKGPPKITDYPGHGSLLGWVRVVALRISIRQREAEKPGTEQAPEDILKMVLEPGPALEMDVIRQRHPVELRQAMSEAFATLSSEARDLLRLYELIILKPDMDQLDLGSEAERALARLAAVTPDAYLFRAGLKAIARYDWARHGLTLTAEATAGLLKALADESRSPRPADGLVQFSRSIGLSKDLEHALNIRGFLVALDGVPRYGGIFLGPMSQRHIEYPVMRATFAAGQATFYQLPVHVPFAMWDPGVSDLANSQHARAFRALINDPQVHALLARRGKLGSG
jgi:RNA polymerase sigma-70 factor